MPSIPQPQSDYADYYDANAEALVHAFAMIIFSEIGDKTFLIAAILAMRHPRLIVFAGAFGALLVMSVLSAGMGHLLPTLVPKRWTQIAAGVMFLVFGSKMLLEARQMQGGSAKMQEEMKEAEQEIEGDEAGQDGTGTVTTSNSALVIIPLERMEEGESMISGSDAVDESTASPRSPRPKTKITTAVAGLMDGARNFCSLLLGPIFVQAFVLTFLGEWGDRSQIATIALGAANNVYLVTIGTLIGHTCCTALAVTGGRYISSKISVKHVTLGGAILFLLFGIIYLYESFAASAEDLSIPLDPVNAAGPL